MTDKSVSGKTVLISGAGIAGLTVAYWLSKYGFDVTVIERSKTIREGGYPVDIRGTAIDVVDRMGIYSQLKKAHINTKAISFINPDGNTAATIQPEKVSGGEKGRDLELQRGSLTGILFDLIKRHQIQYRFGDSISILNVNNTNVDVEFMSGQRECFDIVIGADGIHSTTRCLIFGKEEQFIRYLGYGFNGFTIQNNLGLSHEVVIYATPGRAAMVYASGKSDTLNVLLSFKSDKPSFIDYNDSDKQCRLIAEKFSDGGWKTPYLVKAMKESDDLYCDIVGQIHMSCWSKDRIALVGDSAFAPSFFSGQGSSLAMVGAYILAGELASHEEHKSAFAAYEKMMRPFAKANQAQADSSASFLIPGTGEELEIRNQALTALQSLDKENMPDDESNNVYSSLRLPDYR